MSCFELHFYIKLSTFLKKYSNLSCVSSKPPPIPTRWEIFSFSNIFHYQLSHEWKTNRENIREIAARIKKGKKIMLLLLDKKKGMLLILTTKKNCTLIVKLCVHFGAARFFRCSNSFFQLCSWDQSKRTHVFKYSRDNFVELLRISPQSFF